MRGRVSVPIRTWPHSMTRRRLAIGLSVRAETDRESIAAYGIETWGEERAAAYIAALDRAIDGLTENPAIGQVRFDLRDGVRHFPVRQHVVDYSILSDRIWVRRILHTRQDPTAAAGI